MKIWRDRGCCSSQREQGAGYYDSSWIHSFIWFIILLGAILYYWIPTIQVLAEGSERNNCNRTRRSFVLYDTIRGHTSFWKDWNLLCLFFSLSCSLASSSSSSSFVMLVCAVHVVHIFWSWTTRGIGILLLHKGHQWCPLWGCSRSANGLEYSRYIGSGASVLWGKYNYCV